jgi:hypothetical protein
MWRSYFCARCKAWLRIDRNKRLLGRPVTESYVVAIATLESPAWARSAEALDGRISQSTAVDTAARTRAAPTQSESGRAWSADTVNSPVALIQYSPPAVDMTTTTIQTRPASICSMDDLVGDRFDNQA